MFELLLDDLTSHQSVPTALMAFRLTGTALMCGIIGLERELHKNSAGLRTNMLVGLAAATFALITLTMIADISGPQSVRADPIRLVEAVTGGVAFLAAGIIVFTKGEVRGLTTGASMWLSASIGLSVGLGYWIIGFLATIGGFAILRILRRFEVATGMKSE